MKRYKKNIWFILFIFLYLNLSAQEINDKKNKLRYSDKIIHSFGIQYNNAFHAKGKFEYKDAPDYYIGAHPAISYGSEYIFKYNLTFPSGWGITTEFVAGNRSFRSWRLKSNDEKDYWQDWWVDPLAPFLDYTYFGAQLKASYTYRLHERITMQPEVGIKLLKYIGGMSWITIQPTYIPDENGYPILVDMWSWYEVDNDHLAEKFVPELTAGINFMFHTKRDPRHNFVLGINGTLGFVDRYAGLQRKDRDTPWEEADISMRWGSSFFAVNLGYEFKGFTKPLYKTKKAKKEMEFETFDFSKPIHSIGIYFTSGFSFKPQVRDAQGEFLPIFSSSYVPEFNLRYSMMIKDGLGFTIEIPFGIFQRYVTYSLVNLIPADYVWADGKATGPGFPDDIGMLMPYTGIALKCSYLTQISNRMFIQPEAGIKFVPYIYRLESWSPDDNSLDYYVHYVDNDGRHTDIKWLFEKTNISHKNYWTPDITLAVNFMLHGKKPNHNFIFGINANIGFMDRISFDYNTTEVVPEHIQSSGSYGWKSSYIGFHLGYQFMTGKKQK